MAERGDFTKKTADEFIKVLLETVEEALKSGDSVKIKDLGTFKTQWNEARRSVDVNTGEEIIIPGFYKVVFQPDNDLKLLVNEPFAHLEPVNLDSEEEPVVEVESEPDDTDDDELEEAETEASAPIEPIKIFEEQALEIKGLLSEINSIDNDEDELLPDLADEEEELKEDEVEMEESEHVVHMDDGFGVIRDLSHLLPDEPVEAGVEESDEPEVVTLTEEKISEESSEEKENDTTDQSKNIAEPKKATSKVEEASHANATKQKTRKKSVLVWSVLILLLLGSGGWAINNWYSYKEKSKQKKRMELIADSIANELQVRVIADSLSKGRDSLGLDFDSDTVEVIIAEDLLEEITEAAETAESKQAVAEKPAPVVSAAPLDLEQLKKLPRNLNQFIATEKMVAGSQLTQFAKKHYGHPHFWVYIYEANKSKISNPDNVPAGIDVKIPKVDKRLVDPTNKQALEFALQLQREYLLR